MTMTVTAAMLAPLSFTPITAAVNVARNSTSPTTRVTTNHAGVAVVVVSPPIGFVTGSTGWRPALGTLRWPDEPQDDERQHHGEPEDVGQQPFGEREAVGASEAVGEDGDHAGTSPSSPGVGSRRHLIRCEDGAVRDKVEQTIEAIRPAIQADGGDIELRDVDEATGVVTVELIGACVSCPASTVTLKAGIERILKDRVEGVTEVINFGDDQFEGTPLAL